MQSVRDCVGTVLIAALCVGCGSTSIGRARDPAPAPAPVVEAAPAPAPAPAPVAPPPTDESLAQTVVVTGLLTPKPGIQDTSRLYWNAWLSRGKERVESIRSGSRYQVNLSLSGGRFEHAISTSPTIRDYLEKAIAERAVVSLRVRLHVLGSGLAVSPEPPLRGENTGDEAYDIDVGKYVEIMERPVAPAEPATSADERFSAMLEDSILRLKIPVKAAKSRGCAQLAFSVWDETDSRPLDHVVFSFVVNGSAAEYEALCGVQKMQGGFGAMAGALSARGGAQASAALFMFEYTAPASTRKTRAIFVGPALPGNGDAAEILVSTWEFDGSAATRVSEPDFQQVIDRARKIVDYKDASIQLAQSLFPADLEGAQDALKSLVGLKEVDGQHSILVRYVKSDGEYAFLPLGLLNLPEGGIGSLAFVSPLPRESYTRACFKKWTFAYPEKITGTPTEPPWDPGTMESRRGGTRFLRQMDDLSTYLYPQSGQASLHDATATDAGEGFLLLSHHGQGKVWFVDDPAQPAKIQVFNSTKRFDRGSVALLSACSTANVSGDHDSTIRHLNRAGIDAIVASPFEVNADYGMRLSEAFIKVVVQSYDNREQLSLKRLFELATAQVEKKSGSALDKLMKYEFLIMGDHTISFCDFGGDQ